MWASFFNINMSDAQIFTVPVKLGLKFMPIVSLNSMYPEWKFAPCIVYELNCATLVMLTIYFQCLSSCCVINCCILEAFNSFPEDLSVKDGNLTSTWILCPGTCVSYLLNCSIDLFLRLRCSLFKPFLLRTL